MQRDDSHSYSDTASETRARITSREAPRPVRPARAHGASYQRTLAQGELRERLRHFFLEHAAAPPET
jgi:hypothetical protein